MLVKWNLVWRPDNSCVSSLGSPGIWICQKYLESIAQHWSGPKGQCKHIFYDHLGSYFSPASQHWWKQVIVIQEKYSNPYEVVTVAHLPHDVLSLTSQNAVTVMFSLQLQACTVILYWLFIGCGGEERKKLLFLAISVGYNNISYMEPVWPLKFSLPGCWNTTVS